MLSYSKAAIAVTMCLGVGLGVAVRNCAYYPLQVTSNSMLPTVAAGDWVVVSPDRSPKRGDIVLFHFPYGSNGLAIKRVAALGHDRVKAGGKDVVIQAGYVYILGDNLNSSVDSRTLGPLAEADVLGKVALVIRNPF